MPCYRPLLAYRSKTVGPNGKRGIVFNKNDGFNDMEISLPCGKCIGCRIERSKEWAVRIMHESTLHEENIFLRLSYDNEHIPPNQSLDKRHCQLFMKALRNRVDKKLRFYLCGEYGEKNNRPHYHVILFGYRPKDAQYLSIPFRKHNLYRSEEIERSWKKGQIAFGEVTFESAQYVSKYCHKLITGELSNEHYGDRIPEFALMSRNPGIGKNWYVKHHKDLFPRDECKFRRGGKIIDMSVPKYYTNLYEQENPDDYARIKRERRKQIRPRTIKHLASQEEIITERTIKQQWLKELFQ